jgi:hypothetical protein
MTTEKTEQMTLFETTPLTDIEAEVLRLKRFGLTDSDIFVEVCLMFGGAAIIPEIIKVAEAKAQEFHYPMAQVTT